MVSTSGTLKAVLVVVLGIALVYLVFTQAVPDIMGNTTTAIWIAGTDYAWVGTVLIYVLLIASIVIVLKFL